MRSAANGVLLLMAVALVATTAVPGAAQVRVRGQVAVDAGPVGLRVVVGEDGRYVRGHRQYATNRETDRGYRSAAEVEFALERVEADRKYYREIRKHYGAGYIGWTEYELDRHLDWLDAERKYLKEERKRLRRIERAERRYYEDLRRAEREYRRDVERERRERLRGRG